MGEAISIPSLRRYSVWPSIDATRPEVRYDVDDAFHDLYETALAATKMRDRPLRRQRHYLIPQVLRRVKRLPGEFAEVGCYRGLSAFVSCSVLQSLGHNTAFHIFDSFEGLSKPTDVDASVHLPAQYQDASNLFACSEEQVRTNLALFPFVRYHKGWVPDCFGDASHLRFAYVHIDVDLYQPTRDAVAFFWPRLVPGGAMVLDDYGTMFFPGARKGAGEILDGCEDAFVVEAPAGSAAVIKLGVGV